MSDLDSRAKKGTYGNNGRAGSDEGKTLKLLQVGRVERLKMIEEEEVELVRRRQAERLPQRLDRVARGPDKNLHKPFPE